MRPETATLISGYLSRTLPLETLRAFVEGVDWDSHLIPEAERSLLLTVELYIAGMDEGFSDESELREYLFKETRPLSRS